MSTVSKIFIVLVTVFSIAFTAMTVSVVAQSTNWRDTALKYEQHARVTDANLRAVIDANAAELASARDSVVGHLATIGDLEKKLQDASSEVAKLRSELAKADAERGSTEAMNRALLSQLEMARMAEAEYRQQRDKLERDSVDFQQRNIDLNDRVNELTAQVSVLAEQKRHYEQQINVLQTDVQKLSRQASAPAAGTAMESPAGAAMRGVSALSPVRTAAIRGKVLKVDGNLVTLSIGSADGVRKDMRFVVHRDGQYVADVTVNLVDPDKAAGRLAQSAGAIHEGDDVIDAVSLAGSGK